MGQNMAVLSFVHVNSGEGVTVPRFSIRRVNKIASGGKRTDTRKHSDDFEVRLKDIPEIRYILTSSLHSIDLNFNTF